MSKFLESLVVNNLTFAGNMVAKKTHIVRLSRSAYDDHVDALPRQLSKAKRAQAIAEIKPVHRERWTATALCGVRGEQSTYGNVQRYYWEPVQNPSMEHVCGGCLGAWRKLDEPEIAGYDRTARPDEDWPWPLPLGWQAVAPSGHPWDVPADQPIENVKDKTGDVVGQHRVELRRWTRGSRIVRLVHHTDSDTYAARYWREGAAPQRESYASRGSLQSAREECQKLMAQGGY